MNLTQPLSPFVAVLALLVAAEFLFIFYLETIATTSERTAKVFGMDTSELARDSVSTLFKNQGVCRRGRPVPRRLHRRRCLRRLQLEPQDPPHAGRPGDPLPHLLPLLIVSHERL